MLNLDRRRHWEGGIFLVAFTACVPAANWMIGNLGTVCVPDGPCLIPVAPGITAPRGVLLVGLALVLRDLVQRRLGLSWAAGAHVMGAALSATFATPALVVAPAIAFSISVSVTLAVLNPLLPRRQLIST